MRHRPVSLACASAHDLVALGDASLAECRSPGAADPRYPVAAGGRGTNIEPGPLGLGSLASAIVALLLAFIAVLLVVGRVACRRRCRCRGVRPWRKRIMARP